MTKEQLILLYEYLIKQTKENSEFLKGYEDVLEWELEYEIDRLLIKYDCIPL